VNYLITLLLFLFSLPAAHATVISDTLVINNTTREVSFNKRELYFFSKEDLPVERVISNTFRFKKDVDIHFITGYLWIKFVVKNKSDEDRFVIHTPSGHVSGFYLYKPTSEGYVMTEPKLHHPEDGREIFNKAPAFFLDLKKGEAKTYYLKIVCSDEVVDFEYIIRGVTDYTTYVQADYLISGLYFGALMVIIIINLFYFFSLKNKLFLIYAGYVLSSFFFVLTLDGFNWLIFSDPVVANNMAYFFLRSWMDSLLFFTMHLVNLKKISKPLTIASYIYLAYHIGLSVIQPFNPFNITSTFIAELEHTNYVIGILLVGIIMIRSYKFNKYLFKYYLIGFGALFLSVVTLTIYTVADSDSYLFFQHGIKTGTFIEILAMSFAVARRFKITENELIAKKEREQLLNDKVKQLEMDVRKAQMNPHFTFNALNSIQYFILNKKKEDACIYLAKFARLMRLTLDHSRSSFVPLRDEINALTLYVELEWLRLKNKHEYQVIVANDLDLDGMLIPPLLIQPFIENAIWHGLQRKTEKSNLRVSIAQIHHELVCTVEDDGIGISTTDNVEKTENVKKSSGIEITKERLMLIHTLLGTKDELIIEDKKDRENGGSGTFVKFNIPFIREERNAGAVFYNNKLEMAM